MAPLDSPSTTSLPSLREEFEARLTVSQGDVLIRTFQKKDITPRYISWLNNPEVVLFSNQRFITHTESSCQSFYLSMSSSPSSFLAIEHAEYGHVGTLTVHFNDHHGTADIGILVGEPSIWGKGVGLAAWTLAMTAALKIPRMRKVTAGTLACNAGMLSIMRKSGMVEDGIRVNQELVEGQPYDMQYYAYFSNDS
ncbi:MAG: GNAT family N-acetyltransferase [Thalassolituus sp.]